jgi:hypothetical protein
MSHLSGRGVLAASQRRLALPATIARAQPSDGPAPR